MSDRDYKGPKTSVAYRGCSIHNATSQKDFTNPISGHFWTEVTILKGLEISGPPLAFSGNQGKRVSTVEAGKKAIDKVIATNEKFPRVMPVSKKEMERGIKYGVPDDWIARLKQSNTTIEVY